MKGEKPLSGEFCYYYCQQFVVIVVAVVLFCFVF